MKEKCPLCLVDKEYDLEIKKYLKFQNTQRLVCEKCASEIAGHMRPTWQVIAGRVFPKSTRYL